MQLDLIKSLKSLYSLLLVTLGFNSLLMGQTPLTNPFPQSIQKGNISAVLTEVADGFSAPVHLANAGDGSNRLFVVEQAGVVKIIENGAVLGTPFMDITDQVVDISFNGEDERGLLGLAFHPDFDDSELPGFGKVYTYFSQDTTFNADFTHPGFFFFDHESVVAEWTVDPNFPDQVDPASRRDILRIDQPQYWHNAGALVFDENDYLCIAIGDGGSDFAGGDNGFPNNISQDHSNVYGSILKIAPLHPSLTPGSADAISNNGAYRVPASNPLVGIEGVDEIYAYGFRNPYRMSIEPSSGALLVADVGEEDIEEVNLVQANQNFGWNEKEGQFRFNFVFDPQTFDAEVFVSDDLAGLPAGLVDPLVEYDHDEGVSVIGGYVYESANGSALDGMYVFGDWVGKGGGKKGRLFYTDLDDAIIKELEVEGNSLNMYIRGFGMGENNELFLVASENGGTTGTGGHIFRLQANDEEAPVADSLGVTKISVKAGKDRQNPVDQISLSGTLTTNANELTGADDFTFDIGDGIFSETIDLAEGDVKKGKLSKKIPTGTSLKIDLNKGTFSISAKGVDLSGLSTPFDVFVSFGDFDEEDTVETALLGKKTLPLCLMTGVADILDTTKAAVKTNKKGSSLNLSGQIAAVDLNLNLVNEAVTVTWGSFNEVIPDQSFTNKKGRKFSYKKPKGGNGFVAKLDIDFDKCTIKLSIKDAGALDTGNNINFDITSVSFSANDLVSVP